MNTIELIEDVCLFGGTVPNERIEEVKSFLNKAKNLQLHKTSVMCSLCGDEGYTIEVEAECCRNPDENGNCCNIPIPVQVQKQCYCSGEGLPI